MHFVGSLATRLRADRIAPQGQPDAKPKCIVGRPRATSNEWRQYYAQADEIRARVGDPFQRLIQRREIRTRVVRICGLSVAAVVFPVLLYFLFDLTQNLLSLAASLSMP
jgi:hypothetical protein